MAKDEPKVEDSAVKNEGADESGTAPPEETTTAAETGEGGIDLSKVEASPDDTAVEVPAEVPEADVNAEVSPTGTANVAGTPQSQLSQAPPMEDLSGSNVPAPNLRQPLIEGYDPGAAAPSVSRDSLDQALVDPDTAPKERVEGRTSDASLRSADSPHIDEVPADVNDGPKPSDGGPERYPFPQGGDVDVATVPNGTNAGEYYPNIEIEDSVVLLKHDLVPDRLVGRRALVVDAPRYLVPLDKKDDVWITVQTRDEANARLTLPLAAVEVFRGALDITRR